MTYTRVCIYRSSRHTGGYNYRGHLTVDCQPLSSRLARPPPRRVPARRALTRVAPRRSRAVPPGFPRIRGMSPHAPLRIPRSRAPPARRTVSPPVLRTPAGVEEHAIHTSVHTSWLRTIRRNFSNFARPSGFDIKSAGFSSVGTNSGRTIISSTSSRILRWRRSMCFVRELDT